MLPAAPVAHKLRAITASPPSQAPPHQQECPPHARTQPSARASQILAALRASSCQAQMATGSTSADIDGCAKHSPVSSSTHMAVPRAAPWGHRAARHSLKSAPELPAALGLHTAARERSADGGATAEEPSSPDVPCAAPDQRSVHVYMYVCEAHVNPLAFFGFSCSCGLDAVVAACS